MDAPAGSDDPAKAEQRHGFLPNFSQKRRCSNRKRDELHAWADREASRHDTAGFSNCFASRSGGWA